MADTVLFSQTRDGTQVAEFPQASNLTYTFRLNAPGSISFDLPAEKIPAIGLHAHRPEPVYWDGERAEWGGHPAYWGSTPQTASTPTLPISEVLEDGVHEIGVRRGGQVVWLGPLLTIDEPAGGRIGFGGEGLGAYLRRMHVLAALPGTNDDGEYVGDDEVDSGLLVKRLVDHHQAKGGGDFGIDTSATATTGVDVENTEVAPSKGANVYGIVTGLAEADTGGFDWEVTPDTRQLVIHAPRRGIRRRDLVLDEANIVRFQRRRDATQQASAVIGFGNGDEARTLRRVRTNSAAVAKYGLTEQTLSLPNEGSVAALDAQVAAALRQWRRSANVITVTFRPDSRTPLFSFQLGDRVRVLYDSPWRPIAAWRRIVGFDIHPHPVETVDVHLEEF